MVTVVLLVSFLAISSPYYCLIFSCVVCIRLAAFDMP